MCKQDNTILIVVFILAVVALSLGISSIIMLFVTMPVQGQEAQLSYPWMRITPHPIFANGGECAADEMKLACAIQFGQPNGIRMRAYSMEATSMPVVVNAIIQTVLKDVPNVAIRNDSAPYPDQLIWLTPPVIRQDVKMMKPPLMPMFLRIIAWQYVPGQWAVIDIIHNPTIQQHQQIVDQILEYVEDPR